MKTTLAFFLFIQLLGLSLSAQLSRSIRITNTNLQDYRDLLTTIIFGQKTLPDYKVDTAIFNVKKIKHMDFFPYPNIKNLKQIDEYSISTCKNCEKVYTYVFTPINSINNKKLMIYASGHGSKVTPIEDLTYADGKVIPLWISSGYTVLAVPMVFYKRDSCVGNCHDYMIAELENERPIEYIFKPLLASLNTINRDTFKKIYMMGFSGGGYLSSIYPAMDTIIEKSFPIAGSSPLQLSNLDDLDREQYFQDIFGKTDGTNIKLNYEDIYVLASAGKDRKMLQINNRNDDCCFMGPTRHIYYVNSVKETLSKMKFPNQYSYYLDTVSTKHMISAKALQIIDNAIKIDECYLKSKPNSKISGNTFYKYDIKRNITSRSSTLDKNNLYYTKLKAPKWLNIDHNGILSGRSSNVSSKDTVSFQVQDSKGNFLVNTFILHTK